MIQSVPDRDGKLNDRADMICLLPWHAVTSGKGEGFFMELSVRQVENAAEKGAGTGSE